MADVHSCSHLIVETGTETGTETETEPNDRVANARDLRTVLPGPGARTTTTAGRGTLTGSATAARVETATPPVETETLTGSGDVVVMAAVVVTGAVRGLPGRRPEELEVVRTSSLLPRGSALRLHR